MPDPRARLAKIRRGLSPAEWARFGGMVAAVVGLHVLGWVMLTAALSGHYHISKTTVFGVGTGALAYTLGMRQHHPQAGQRGQAAALGGVFLLPGPLQRGVRARRAAELRHPGP